MDKLNVLTGCMVISGVMRYIHRLQQKMALGQYSVQQTRFPLRFLQAELSHTQLFLTGEMLQSLAFLFDPSLDSPVCPSLSCRWAQPRTQYFRCDLAMRNRGPASPGMLVNSTKLWEIQAGLSAFSHVKYPAWPPAPSWRTAGLTWVESHFCQPCMVVLGACMVMNTMFKQQNLIPTVWFHGVFFPLYP